MFVFDLIVWNPNIFCISVQNCQSEAVRYNNLWDLEVFLLPPAAAFVFYEITWKLKILYALSFNCNDSMLCTGSAEPLLICNPDFLCETCGIL